VDEVPGTDTFRNGNIDVVVAVSVTTDAAVAAAAVDTPPLIEFHQLLPFLLFMLLLLLLLPWFPSVSVSCSAMVPTALLMALVLPTASGLLVSVVPSTLSVVAFDTDGGVGTGIIFPLLLLLLVSSTAVAASPAA
jgi:hypothetical protein